jgi:methylamine--corrinoid protein Co-methyltransferase
MTIDRDMLMDVLDRAHQGPISTDRDFNVVRIPTAVGKAMEKYGLAGAFDPSNPVNTEDELADRFFQAGLDAAAEIGMLCNDTNRIVEFARDELLSAVERAPEEFWIGEGEQQARFGYRGVEDPDPPALIAPLSIAVSEDLFVPMVEGIARVPEVMALEGPSLETMWDRLVLGGSPYELLSGRYQADLMEEGIRRAGRPGMGLHAVGSSTTQYGFLGGYGVPGGYSPNRNIALILSPTGLRVSYEGLFKLAQVYNCGGDRVYAASWAMIGGYSGGPEGATIECIASALLLFTIYQASQGGCHPFDLRYNGNTGRKGLWAFSVSCQALSRNTHIVLNTVLNQVAGPCTKMLLYETLVGMTNLSVSGASSCKAARSAGGRLTNYLTPLEIKFAGEVFDAAAGASRAQANDVAIRFLPNYESRLTNPPDGKGFSDCYDVEELQPTEEWQRMYDEVKEEAVQAGLALR